VSFWLCYDFPAGADTMFWTGFFAGIVTGFVIVWIAIGPLAEWVDRGQNEQESS
jgi:hypothetical protein